jgi:hypothetical protein
MLEVTGLEYDFVKCRVLDGVETMEKSMLCNWIEYCFHHVLSDGKGLVGVERWMMWFILAVGGSYYLVMRRILPHCVPKVPPQPSIPASQSCMDHIGLTRHAYNAC